MTDTRPTVVIPAAGAASRMGAAPGDPPKCLLPVGGVPILQRLVDSCLCLPEVRVVVLVPPGEPHVRRWRLGRPYAAAVSVHPAPREPFGRTVLRGLDHVAASQAAVLDSDLVVSGDELAGFLRYAWDRPDGAALTVGTSTDPWDLGPRTIWYTPVGPGRARLGRGLAERGEPGRGGGRARLVGAYWFRTAAVESLRGHVARGQTSFGSFLSEFARGPGGVDGYPFRYAFDVNTATDLVRARTRVEAESAGT